MAITLKVEAQADNRSFKAAADQAEKTFASAGKSASEVHRRRGAPGGCHRRVVHG